ncbi:MAG: hypothetical protein JNL93_20760 [Pelomonas sp.]|nr:hypothetical protein [Roseateles sp.]
MERQDGKLVMCVMDRGSGIPARDADKITKPFYRIEGSRSRETGGTRLGLAIVQRPLVHCQGDLELSPREGGGFVAAVRIPL